MSSSTTDQALAEEQEHVTGLYARLDAARELAVTRRQQAISAPLVDNPQAMGEKEAAVRFHGTRIVQLDAAEAGLVLGRLDREDVAQPLYVGRTGLPADDAGGDPALVDWRAPASRPFYTATPFRPRASPGAGTSAPWAGRSPASTTRCWCSPRARRPTTAG